MMRGLLALALLVPAPSIPQTVAPLEPVPMVLCPNGDVVNSGTAFRVGPRLLVSVKHVTNLAHCSIDGERIHIAYTSPKADFSMLSDDRSGRWLKVDCRGFVPGHTYVAVGHARGADELTAVALVATGANVDGMAVLVGILEFQPGMSGGPVIDAETHAVVGTVNAANWEDGTSFSIALRGTPVCQGHTA